MTLGKEILRYVSEALLERYRFYEFFMIGTLKKNPRILPPIQFTLGFLVEDWGQELSVFLF